MNRPTGYRLGMRSNLLFLVSLAACAHVNSYDACDDHESEYPHDLRNGQGEPVGAVQVCMEARRDKAVAACAEEWRSGLMADHGWKGCIMAHRQQERAEARASYQRSAPSGNGSGNGWNVLGAGLQGFSQGFQTQSQQPTNCYTYNMGGGNYSTTCR